MPKIIIRDLNHIRKLKTIRKQPENEFFNSLIETGKRLQNLTLNKKIQTVLLLNFRQHFFPDPKIVLPK